MITISPRFEWKSLKDRRLPHRGRAKRVARKDRNAPLVILVIIWFMLLINKAKGEARQGTSPLRAKSRGAFVF